MIYTHHVKQFHSDTCARSGSVSITLPGLPGLTITSDRSETDPTLPTIRARKGSRAPTGVAALALLDRRIDEVAGAIIAARYGIADEVTL